jgi:hypothetical protein
MRAIWGTGLLVAACSATPRSRPDAHVPICPAQAVIGWEEAPFDPDAGPLDFLDRDGDGWTVAQGDCDDTNPAVHPGAPEVCDLVDDDCNGVIDDGDVCPDRCPIDFPEAHCCDATHRIAGTFIEPASASWPILPGVPYAVVLRRMGSGETRAASVCPAPAEPQDSGRRFRFELDDPDFIEPHVAYEVLIHLRWYFPAVLHELDLCFRPVPVATTDANAVSCGELGRISLTCF